MPPVSCVILKHGHSRQYAATTWWVFPKWIQETQTAKFLGQLGVWVIEEMDTKNKGIFTIKKENEKN